MPALTQDGTIWTITLDDGENRFTPAFLDAMDEHLDEVAGSEEPAALVTVGTGKFFSNGLDLEWLGAYPDRLDWYVDRIHAMFAKVLTLPVPTVAAVNGHAFGGGAMLAMAHDWRVMRSDRGYFCFPEVDIRIPFTEGMSELIQAKLTPQAQVDSMTTGRRYGGDEATSYGIVDAVAEQEDLLTAASARVAHLAGKDRETLGRIKRTMYARAVAALSQEARDR
jgi:enoyl-CoA hydratase/carnithine racemase